MRAIAERITRSWVYRRRVPAAFGHGPMYVSPAGGLRYLVKPMSQIDPRLLGFAEQYVKPGHCVWDLGANLGLFSFCAAAKCGGQGEVVAVEPDTEMVKILRRTANLSAAGRAPVRVVPVAVSNTVDLRRFVVARRSSATNHLQGYGSTQTGGIEQEQTVVTISADWLLTKVRPPDVLKIDVEGAELEVLRGASEVLNRHRPTMLCEAGAESCAGVSELLHEHDYVMFDGSEPVSRRVPIDTAVYATIAIHRSNVP